jgi:serine/threonine protein phosphatase PrpC
VERAADTLVETAVTRDGKDNITVVLARYTS